MNPIPTTILKEFLPELLPSVTRMCNASLQERHAIVSPNKNPDYMHRMLKIVDLYQTCRRLRKTSLSATRTFPREAQPAAKMSIGLQTLSFDGDCYLEHFILCAFGSKKKAK